MRDALNHRQRLMRFVLSVGVVSFFADFTYEGGRSVVGPFLALLGAGPIMAGAVAGFGEVLGYGVRLFSGRYADRNQSYWPVMGIGYTLNLLAVPALALASSLAPAALLVFVERLGKGLRNPPRDTLLAQAGNELGHGRVFGIHELLDQTGAFLGPLAVAAAVAWGGYRLGFALLLIPALAALAMLLRARAMTPSPRTSSEVLEDGPMPRTYLRYLLFSAVTVAGFAHFILVSYHFGLAHRLPPVGIPLAFGLAMGIDALAALAAGHLFDRIGFRVLLGLPVLIVVATPLLFLAHSYLLIGLGMAFWGAAMGVQESVMRAGVAHLSPERHRGRAFGTFDATFGVAWLVGSVALGALYRLGPSAVVAFVTILQILAVPLLLWTLRALPAQ